jgi:signal transduction histidine kinase
MTLFKKISDMVSVPQDFNSSKSVHNISDGKIVETLAHELRNSLSPIVSTLEILRLRETDPESVRLIKNATEELQDMRSRLDDVLDVARTAQRED